MKKKIVCLGLFLFSFFNLLSAQEAQKKLTSKQNDVVSKQKSAEKESADKNTDNPSSEDELLKKIELNPKNLKKKKIFLSDRKWIDDDEANDLLTPLERYLRRTNVNIFRRTEAIFFISIPFSALTQFSIKNSMALFNAAAAAMEDGESPIFTGHFRYTHENAIANTLDPFYVYTWTANIFWPFVIAMNDVIERTTTNAYTLKTKKNIRLWRFEADLMHTDF